VKKDWRLVFLALVLSLVIAAGCSRSGDGGAPAGQAGSAGPGAPGYPMELTDDLGAKVTLDKEPKRLVSLSPSNTELLFALGLGDRVVGVTEWCDYPPEAKTKPKIGDLRGNLEKILAAQPDLVVASASLNRDMVDRLRQLGMKVLAVEPQSVEEVYKTILLVGRATNSLDRAEALVAELKGRIEAVQKRLASVPPGKRVRVFIEVDYTLYTAGPGSYIDDLVRLAGGRNVVTDLRFYGPYSEEKVIDLDPEVILAVDYYYLPPEKKIEKRPGWQAIKAVKEGRIITDVELANVVNRPGPRAAQAVEALARAFYPELFR